MDKWQTVLYQGKRTLRRASSTLRRGIALEPLHAHACSRMNGCQAHRTSLASKIRVRVSDDVCTHTCKIYSEVSNALIINIVRTRRFEEPASQAQAVGRHLCRALTPSAPSVASVRLLWSCCGCARCEPAGATGAARACTLRRGRRATDLAWLRLGARAACAAATSVVHLQHVQLCWAPRDRSQVLSAHVGAGGRWTRWVVPRAHPRRQRPRRQAAIVLGLLVRSLLGLLAVSPGSDVPLAVDIRLAPPQARECSCLVRSRKPRRRRCGAQVFLYCIWLMRAAWGACAPAAR